MAPVRVWSRFLFQCCMLMCCPRILGIYVGAFTEWGVVTVNQTFRFVGETLELYCNITNASLRENSSMLHFTVKTSQASATRFNKQALSREGDYIVIPPENIEILTTKAIRLTIRNLDITDDGVYTCIQDTFSGENRVIDHEIIKVDYKPQKVEKVTCRVYNWETMTCSWDLGVKFQHPENINVSVAWAIHGSQYDCPKLNKTSCHWNEDTYQHGDQYLMVVEVKTMVDDKILWEERSPQFRIETQLYETSGVVTPFSFTSNYANSRVVALVEPAPVSELKAVVENSTCIRLTWKHSSRREKVFVGEYRMKGEEAWRNLILNEHKINGTSKKYQSLVNNLAPFTSYQFRLCVLPFPVDTPGREPDEQGHRSQWQFVDVNTTEDVPSTAPKICHGCFFEIKCTDKVSQRCIRMYWQDLSSREKRGVLIMYNISYSSTDLNESYSKILSISHGESVNSDELSFTRSNASYNISLTPATQKGFARFTSSLLLPTAQLRLQPPQSFLVETDDSRDDVKFYLSWAAVNVDPKATKIYSGLTVVWCIGIQLESRCQSNIKWINLTADQVTYELELQKRPRNFLIGITAEIYSDDLVYSSGIQWSYCIYLRNQKPQNSPKNVRQHTRHPVNGLTILWDKFECTEERSFITEYLVKYCPSYEGKMCMETEKSQNVSNNASDVTLNHLKAETKYRVSVYAVSSAGLGPTSTIFTQPVEGPPPEPESQTHVIIIIAVCFGVIFLLAIMILCYRYCLSRKKKVPDPDDLIEPYAQATKQDIRNRPLPKTPEDPHIYGSSACMNNPGCDKMKDNRNSESSSEDSVSSHTKLLSHLTHHKQNSSLSPQLRSIKLQNMNSHRNSTNKNSSAHEVERLLDPSKSPMINKDQAVRTQACIQGYSVLGLREPGHSQEGTFSLPKGLSSSNFAPGKNTSAGNFHSSCDEYHQVGFDESDSGKLPSDPRNMSKSHSPVNGTALDISKMDTLPLRSLNVLPNTNISLYLALDANGHPVNPLSIIKASGRASDMGLDDMGMRPKPRNPAYIRSYQPKAQSSAATGEMPSSPLKRPDVISGYSTSIPFDALNKQNDLFPDPRSQNSVSDFLTDIPQTALNNPVCSDKNLNSLPWPNSEVSDSNDNRDVFFNKRHSVPIESVLHFPPPPSSPPPSPCPEDSHYNMDMFPSSSTTSRFMPDSQNSSSASFSLPSANNSYIVHSAIPRIKDMSLNHLSTTYPHAPAFSVKCLPNTGQIASDPVAERPLDMGSSHYSSSPSISATTLPRRGGQGMSYIPQPNLVSRPLSGDLLDLPPNYYQDPEMGASNQILTEL